MLLVSCLLVIYLETHLAGWLMELVYVVTVASAAHAAWL